MLPAGDSRMEWTLRLVGAGMDGQPRSCDVMVISRPDGLGEIADLGITLAEAKQLLVQVQQQVVAAQAKQEFADRPTDADGFMTELGAASPHQKSTRAPPKVLPGG
jgi:hypothetical protein